MTNQIIMARYFVKDGQGLAVIEQESGLIRSVTNQHILLNPNDLSSDPIPGWEEVDERGFRGAIRAAADKVMLDRQLAASEQNKALREAYQEAVDLGFSDKAARTMSGYAGP